MAIIRTRKDKNNPYVMINKKALQDPKLSAKAKGIHAYIMTLPDDWQLYTKELQTHFTDGRDGISAGLRELEQAGYIKKEKNTTSTGKFDGWNYTIFESTINGNSATENGFTGTAKPKTENPKLLINNLNNNNQNNINTYGIYKNVKLTDQEHEKLLKEYGPEITKEYINSLAIYMKSKGKRYKSHDATIRNWIRRDDKKKPAGDPYQEKWNSLK